MQIFNTRHRQTEKLSPILADNKIRIYSCGPTVYNHAHIGNLSSYIFADILRRSVHLAGFETDHVMNFTDVDDKTIRDSAINYPDLDPHNALTKLTRHYENIFQSEMLEVGNDTSELTFVRATESIDDMKELISKLVAQGIAYIADDGVYFSISDYKKNRIYGQLSHIEVPDETRSRINNDEYDKDSAQDFALWKKQKPGEPAWDFEINGVDLTGRPGWHIECSVMSVGKLGQPFDIHTGGIDLVFPHHENEIAQSTAGDQPALYSNFFVHNEHLLVDGIKMAKSKNNFYTLVDVKAHGFDPLDFRMLILQSHYRSASNFSWDNLIAAQNRRRHWCNVAELRWQVSDSSDDGQTEIVNNLIDQATESLQNDLDTPNALKYIDAAFDQFSAQNVNHFALDNLIKFVDQSLGLKIEQTANNISDQQQQLIQQRESARSNKDFEESDRIRSILESQKIKLNDTPTTIWYRD